MVCLAAISGDQQLVTQSDQSKSLSTPVFFSTQWCRQLFLQWLFLTASVRHLIGLFYWLPVAFLPGAWPSFFAAAVCWQALAAKAKYLASHNQRGKQLEHLEQMDKRVKNLANQRSNQLEHLEQMVKRAKHLANQRGKQLERLEQVVKHAKPLANQRSKQLAKHLGVAATLFARLRRRCISRCKGSATTWTLNASISGIEMR